MLSAGPGAPATQSLAPSLQGQPQLIAQSGLACGEESWAPLALSDLECRSLWPWSTERVRDHTAAHSSQDTQQDAEPEALLFHWCVSRLQAEGLLAHCHSPYPPYCEWEQTRTPPRSMPIKECCKKDYLITPSHPQVSCGGSLPPTHQATTPAVPQTRLAFVPIPGGNLSGPGVSYELKCLCGSWQEGRALGVPRTTASHLCQ